MYSKGAICLTRLLFKMGLFTVLYIQYVTVKRTLKQQRFKNQITVEPRIKEIFSVFMYTVGEGVQSKLST
jgi:hypothetical protein